MATRYYYVPEWKVVIVSLCKIGHSSVTQALINEFGTQRTTGSAHWQRILPENWKDKPGVTRYMMIRHPLDRFVSLWLNKCCSGDTMADHDLSGYMPDELFDYILAHENVHWEHLSKHYTPDTVLVHLDDLDAWWDSLPSKKPMPRLKATQGKLLMDDKLLDKVLDYFSEDVRIWCSGRYWHGD